MLLGLEKPDSGRFDIGTTVKFGYFSQEGLVFDEQKKVIDVITDDNTSCSHPSSNTIMYIN